VKRDVLTLLCRIGHLFVIWTLPVELFDRKEDGQNHTIRYHVSFPAYTKGKGKGKVPVLN